MALRGSVRAFSLVQLLNFLSASGHRGTLSIFHKDAQKTLYLSQGGLYFERSNWSFRLGDALVRRAEISHDQLAQAVTEQEKGAADERLGEVLVRLGFVTPERILAARRFQVEEEIYELFGWEDAFFEFTKDKLPPDFEQRLEDPEEFRFEVQSLLMEAARRLDEWQAIREAHPSEKRLLILSEREGAWERATTALVTAGSRVVTPDTVFDGRTTVGDLSRSLGLSRFEALAMATRLVRGGDVRSLMRHELETRFRSALEGDLSYAIGLYECALETPEFEARGRFLDRVLFGCAQFRDRSTSERLLVHARVSGKRAFEMLLALFRQGITCEYAAREEDRAHMLALGKSALIWRVPEGAQPPDILKHLLAKTTIPEADMGRVREQQRESGRPLQQILVGGGFVTMDTWFRAQKDALLDEVFGIFFLRRPFVEVRTGEQRVQGHGLDIEVPMLPWLHAEVMREIRQWETMLGTIPSVRSIFQITPKGEKSLVGPEDLLRQFDGQRSLEEIMKAQTRSPPEFFAWVYERIEGGRLKALEVDDYASRLEAALAGEQRSEAVNLCMAAVDSLPDATRFRDKLKALQAASTDVSFETTSRHALRGDLASFSLPEVLQSFYMSKRSGTLRVELKTSVESKARQIYFDHGEVYLLAGDHQEISDDDLVDGLIVGGNLTEDQIASAAAAQMKDEVYEIFLWDGAEFEFAADFLPREFSQASSRRRIRLNTYGFLLEAVRRIAEWEEVRKVVPSDDLVVAFPSSEAKLRAITGRGEKDLLLLIDGRHPIADLVRVSGVHRFKAFAVLAELVRDGLLQVIDLSKREADDERALVASNLPTSGVIEEGFVGQLQFVGTLQDMASAGLTGVLRLTDGRRSKEMALIDGVPYRTQPFRPRAAADADGNGAAMLRDSTRDAAEDVSECFSWQGTRFELLVGTLPPRLSDEAGREPMRLEADDFFDTFAQAGERWGLVADIVPRDRTVAFTGDEARAAARARQHPDLAELLDGSRSPEDIARISGKRFTAMSWIAGLFEEGLIEAVDPPEAEGDESWDLSL